MNLHTIRKKLAGILSIALVAAMLFPTSSHIYAQDVQSQEQVTPKIESSLSSQLQLSDQFQNSLAPTQTGNLVPQSDNNNPITVIVELKSDPVALHSAQQGQSLAPSASNQERKIRLEHTAFKSQAKKKLNVVFNREYTKVFNGYSVRIPANEVDQLAKLPNVKAVYPNLEYNTLPVDNGYVYKPLMDESAPHIGANQLWDIGVKGNGIKVGVLDTGVDYRHPSLKDAFKGGWDFVDNDNDPMETLPDSTKPKRPDGKEYHTTHGTHVSGTIVGRGDPNNPNGKNGWVRGVAPGADLYVYRVLGPYGGGSTENIIAAIDRAVTDKMDVINLSLGGTFNNAYTADSVAVNNAVLAGVTVVLAAGNDGPMPGTIGTPGGAHLPISVGASTPPMITSFFKANGIQPLLYAQLAEYAPEISEKGKEFDVVYANFGTSEDYKNINVSGKLVLVSRGNLSFHDKAKNATEAGAAAVIIFNNESSELRAKLEEAGTYAPTYTISRSAGQALKKNLEQGITKITFDTILEKDLLADFSSRGPIYPDYTVKPDITAPGVAIRSSVPAWDGNYTNAYQDSQGTSMAAPHIAGAAALLLEKYNHKIARDELKALLMNNALPIEDRNHTSYTITEQGAGRADLNKSIETTAIALVQATTNATKDRQTISYETGSVSFGLVPSGTYTRDITVKDIANKNQTYTISSIWNGTSNGIDLQFSSSSVTVPANGKESFTVQVVIPPDAAKGNYEGTITLTEQTTNHQLHLPVSLYVGGQYEIASITNLTVKPKNLSPGGNAEETAAALASFDLTQPLEDFKLSVTDLVYGTYMGDFYDSKGKLHLPDIYGERKWGGTVTKDGKVAALPDGSYELAPFVNGKKLDKQAAEFVIDRHAPEYTLNDPPLIIDRENPGKGIIRGKITKDLFIDLHPGDFDQYIATAVVDESRKQLDGTINVKDGTFEIPVNLKPGHNEFYLFVYDIALNGFTEPAEHIVFDNKDIVYAGSSSSKVFTGSPFDVKVNYSVAEAVYSASFSLTYDSKLTLLDVKPSVTLATYQQKHYPDTPLLVHQEITEKDGLKTLNYSISLSGGAYEGEGDLATFTFTGNQEGTYEFKLEAVKLLNESSNSVPIGAILYPKIEIIKPTVPNPKPEPPTYPASSGGSAALTAPTPSGKQLKAGLLTETKKDSTVNAVFKIQADAVQKQLKDKDAKQVQLDISDVRLKEYGEVAFTLDKSTVKLLQESGKDLHLAGADYAIVIPNKSLTELIGTNGLELVVSLSDHKDKGFSKERGEATFTTPMITIRGPKDAKGVTLEITLKLSDASKDIRKAGIYARTQDTTPPWSYVQTGAKADDKKSVTFEVTQFGTYTIAEHVRTFSDIAAHWAKEEIEVIAAHELLRGKDSLDTFKPNDVITQAEFSSLLDRLTNSGKTWEQRIAEPGARNPITREKMVVLLAQALKADLSQSNASLGFKDEARISQDAKAAVAYAVSKGLIKGSDNNTFNPAGTSTRAQAAIILFRVLNEL
ncbi:S8 family serine peptidase [Paenibacillus alvei]|uniref:S8 family serine peptidase n=3 Tax=Paenibacillus TaxID=44249 RepID=UPI002E0F27F3|nr:S8 family serine peptidase [Paenibacillus alvei]